MIAAARALPGLTWPERGSGARLRLGDVIVELGFASREQVDAAAQRSGEEGGLLGRLLVDGGSIDDDQLARALAKRNGLPHVDLDRFEWDRGAAGLIDPAQARRHGALPVGFLEEGVLLVAIADPANVIALDDIAMATGCEVRPALASQAHIDAVIAQLSQLEVVAEEPDDDPNPVGVIELRQSSGQAPVINLVNSIIADAVERGASDVHLEPRRGDLRVRFRLDGVVTDATTVPQRLVAGVISRIKLMAELDISERRLPQDGRVGLTVEGRGVDLRVATLPVMRGEAVVIRVLDKRRLVLGMSDLGMAPAAQERFALAVGALNGAVLVTGPTGSGKTTTLYAALSALNSPDRTLISLEDPIEYELEGVKQVQVNPRTGLTFATGLRSMVRADPDVLMVGEVRDRDTAQMAIESALTGHLVLTTLHTNDAPMAAARLIEMGMEPFLVGSGIECVVAQRLVRRLCDCKRPARATGGFEPHGCVHCSGSGYRGRIGIYEVMSLSAGIRELILTKGSVDEIRLLARREGMATLREDGLAKVRDGVTSATEVMRVLGTGEE